MAGSSRRPASGPTLHVWHRRAGIAAAVVMVLVTLTGIALNHTMELRLDQRMVDSEWLLRLYDIEAPAEPTAFALGAHTVAQLGDRLYFDERELGDARGALIGAVAAAAGFVVAAGGGLVLLTADGRILEQLGAAEGVPPGLRALGTAADGRLVVRAADGDHRLDLPALRWEPIDAKEARVSWARPVTLADDRRAALMKRYRGRGLPLERILLDLHSGRILGRWGVYLVDAVAILTVVLAFTGLWMWARQIAVRRSRARS